MPRDGHGRLPLASQTQYAGKSVDGLRIEPIFPKPALKDDLNDEIPDFGKKGI